MTWMLLIMMAEAKKPKVPPPPPVGWVREANWKGDCYYPPDFGGMQEADRKMARASTLDQMKAQWLGQREDGVTFDANVVDDVETTLLGRPVQIEAVAAQNLEKCKAVMAGGSVDSWASFLGSLKGKLTAGECLQPLTYTLFDYLDIGTGWQRPIILCQGNKAHITGTVSDKYRVKDDGPWITVEGDKSMPATGADMPCNIEGCFFGQLVGKFVTDKGVEVVFPIGSGTVFEAPENGTMYYQINDTVWYDNKYYKSSTIEDRTAITVDPG